MYKIGITTYDNDHQLWETHIGNEKMELCYSAWAKTETLSRYMANLLVVRLQNLSTHTKINSTEP
jgi:hypothetical protein